MLIEKGYLHVLVMPTCSGSKNIFVGDDNLKMIINKVLMWILKV